MTRKGWFRIDGVQEGDRTADEQLKGLEPALAAAVNRTVLDLGAAEGLIAAAFARAGAREVCAIELLPDHCAVARQVCRGLPVRVIQSELAAWIAAHPEPEQFDTVLCLGIAHKLHDPGSALSFAARSARSTVVFRGPGKATMLWDGWLTAKFGKAKVHVSNLFAEHGFMEGETFDSAQGERCQYWHRR